MPKYEDYPANNALADGDLFLIKQDETRKLAFSVLRSAVEGVVHEHFSSTDSSAANTNFITADASGGSFTITVPDPATVTHIIFVKRIDSNIAASVTIDADNSGTIDGVGSIALSGTQKRAAVLISNGTSYFIASAYDGIF